MGTYFSTGMRAKSLQLCRILCDPVDCSLPGSLVHGILQARILEWVAMPSSRRSSQPRDRTCGSPVSCIAGGFFTTSATWEATIYESKVYVTVEKLLNLSESQFLDL